MGNMGISLDRLVNTINSTPEETIRTEGTGMPKTNIQISDETKTDLQAQGKMGETYDKVIKRLLTELAAWRKGRTR